MSPLSKHYKGHGEEVMTDMKRRYKDKADKVFYATEKKRAKKKAKKKASAKHKRATRT